jgi:uncharacterized protein (UPF0216 family)
MNRHIPRQRKNLEELLGDKRPHVVGADGTRHRFKGAELRKIAEMIPESEHRLLKLPIYIEIESNSSGARISGRLETKVVCQVLGLEKGENEMFIYRPDLRILRRELPTATQYIFLIR